MSWLLSLVSVSGLLDLALKSVAAMLLAVVVAALLGRASAAWRHLVWCLSVMSLLLLPALSLALPAWRVAWLPPWTAQSTLDATGPVTQAQFDHRELVVAAPLDDQARAEIVAPTSAAAPVAAVSNSLPATSETTGDGTRSVPTTSGHGTRSVSTALWLAIAWGAGGLLSLVPLAVGLAQLAALRRRSVVIDDRRWLTLLDELRRQLAVRRSVQLRQCDAALAPLTWGALRPVLLVPAEASAWPDARRRLVLLHELAHVRRWDWLTQLVAHFACAMYWFNPLVWLAARQMRIERERACDDLVLASGARASDYAQELLALATGLSSSQLSTLVALPMARRGALEDRLCGILDNRRNRAALTTAAVCLGAALAAAAIAPLAMLRAAPPKPPQSGTEQPPAKTAKPRAEKPAEQPVEKPKELIAAPQRDPLLGKEAAERVKQFPPSFSKSQGGIEIGIAIASDLKAFHLGKRVPLEFVIRNVSKKTLHVEHSLYSPETPPAVFDGDGKQLSIEPIYLSLQKSGRRRDTLKPNEVAVYRQQGLGLGEKPNPPGTFWRPFLTNAAAGKYRMSQQLHVTVREEGQDGGNSFLITTGEIAFEIEPADSAQAKTAPAEKPVDKPAEKPVAKPAEKAVTIRGKVVDDVTMEPVKNLIVQAGKFDPADPKNKRVRGVVLDHTGKPVKGAAVFAVGPAGLTLLAGQAWIQVPGGPGGPKGHKNDSAQSVPTDEQGRFEIPTNGATSLAVSYAQLDAWAAAIPARGDMMIRLPEPARFEISLDIDGADKESVIFYQLLPNLMSEEFKNVVSTRWVTMANPGKLTLTSLPPGKYQICRRPGRILDRQLIELAPGETKSIDYVRGKGARVRGKVTWPKDAVLTGATVSILGETTHKSPFDQFEWNNVFASLGPNDDGTFLTERIPPGTYQLQAYAYKPLTEQQQRRTGAIAPSYHAQVKIEVPADGEFTAPDLALEAIKRGE